MFFLVTGASGVGKSTVRQLIEPEFAGVLDAVELAELGSTPQWNLEWRHRMVERTVLLALESRRRGKHFLLCGDPVPPGEVWAAPSAPSLDGLDVCLLDANAATQTARLTRRGDDPQYLVHHVAFADWMRHHVVDPRYQPEVLTQDSWPEMRWERVMGATADLQLWSSHIIDTSDLPPEEVAAEVARWLRDQLSAMEPRS